MSESFGARLRRQREGRGIDLVAIAEQTKIKLSLFEGLERDDLSHWPSGIFRRAFIRAYAHAVGLDEAETVREFLDVHPEPCDPVFAPALTSGDDAERANAGPHMRLRGLVGAAFGSILNRRKTATAESCDEQPVACAAKVAPAAEPEPAPAVEPMVAPIVAVAPVSGTPPAEPDLAKVADLCTEIARVDDEAGLVKAIEKAARLLDATGLIVWIWDSSDAALKPALAHGYSERVIARLPPVRWSANNATATAFRAGQICAIDGDESASGAIAVPLMTPAGCAGVLAVELAHGRGQMRGVRAAATIFAAMLAQLMTVPEPAEMRGEAAPCA